MSQPNIRTDGDDDEERQSLLFEEERDADMIMPGGGPLGEDASPSSTEGAGAAAAKGSGAGGARQFENNSSLTEENAKILRVFDINKTQTNSKQFMGNSIRTSKYTVITFLPKNLIDQFSKLANIYFLLMMILQTIPQISITGGQPTILMPLMFVICISALKDIFEDTKRHRSDNVENNRPVLRSNKKEKIFVQDQWKHLKVGQIVQVLSDQFFPADLVLLKSSNANGLAYVETKNLDGETNLKHKASVKEIQNMIQEPSQVAELRAAVVCEPPNDYLYKFDGNITFKDSQETFALDHNQLLIRGSSLKNTDWIYGLVVYTGHETKIMMNSSKSRTKFSRLEIATNKQIIFVFLFQVCICLLQSAESEVWSNTYGLDARQYLEISEERGNDIIAGFFVKFGTWLLLFANFVPISLIVTLELVKFFQAYFIQWDTSIYDVERDLPTKVQTSNLNEQLGQVDYVFSDKTGTLTCNIMEFKKFAIGKYSYGIDNPKCKNQADKDVTNFNFEDDIFVDHLNDKSHSNHENIMKFMTHLAICHTVVVEEKKGKTYYNASSPDELALINGAKYFDFVFKTRDEDNNIQVMVQGQKQTFQLLDVIEFTSLRKRMTIIVKTPDNKIKVLCKGADSIILPLIKNDQQNNEIKDIVLSYLVTYAKSGLRTLLLCEKELTESEYAAWAVQYKRAKQVVNKREEQMAKVEELIERGFDLLGASAIEDKLQEDVDKTISSLQKAGIKVWVLTGDKTETAINIGFSCQLINDKTELYILDGTSKSECLAQIAESRKLQINSEGLRQSCTVVSGESLFKIMASERIAQQFLKLATQSQSVIACRMSPKQKADVVRLVINNNQNVTSLAIGDGANDVNMITAAHIGVGISGLEGQQAVSASDYAIGQFMFLKNLLLVHGRESYRKNSYLVCYTFYKNVLFVAPQFWFGFYSAFSGQVFYEKWIYQIFNIVFTAFPVVLFALFDQEHTRATLLSRPKLYQLGLRHECFSTKIFWKWLLYGLVQSCILFHIAFFTFNTSPSWEGKTGDLWIIGTFIYGSVVIFANMRILFDSHSHYRMTILTILASVGSFFLLYYLINLIEWSQIFDLFYESITFATFYANLIFMFFFTFPIDSFLYFIHEVKQATKEYIRKEQKKEYKRQFTQGLDLSKLAPLKKYTGFAFSGEAGHAPQVTDKLFRSTRQIMASTKILQAMRR